MGILARNGLIPPDTPDAIFPGVFRGYKIETLTRNGLKEVILGII